MALEPIAPPVQPMRIPGAMSPAQKRRRDVLVILLAGVGFTFLLAIVGHSAMLWGLQIIADALLGGYAFLLVQYKHRTQERRTKVTHLGQARPLMAPVRADRHEQPMFNLRRTASF